MSGGQREWSGVMEGGREREGGRGREGEGGREREGVVLCDGRWSSVVDVAGWALSSVGGWRSFVMGDCRS